MMRKIVPFLRVVPTLRSPSSAAPSLLAGKPSVVQTLTAVAPGRPDAACFATSSIFTIALPLASCPVITRRTCSAICRLLVVECALGAHDSPATVGTSYTQPIQSHRLRRREDRHGPRHHGIPVHDQSVRRHAAVSGGRPPVRPPAAGGGLQFRRRGYRRGRRRGLRSAGAP